MNSEMIKLLAEAERAMDSGAVSHVVLSGDRVAVSNAAMKEFGLENGQTINPVIFIEITKFHISEIEAGIAINRASKASA